MPNYSLAVIMGHATRDAELKYTQNGTAICKVTVAVNHKYKDQKDVSFIDVTCWQKMAEMAAQIKKGEAVMFSGRIQQESWTSKDGEKRAKLVVVADTLRQLSGRQDSQQGPSQQQQGPSQQQQDEDIPF